MYSCSQKKKTIIATSHRRRSGWRSELQSPVTSSMIDLKLSANKSQHGAQATQFSYPRTGCTVRCSSYWITQGGRKWSLQTAYLKRSITMSHTRWRLRQLLLPMISTKKCSSVSWWRSEFCLRSLSPCSVCIVTRNAPTHRWWKPRKNLNESICRNSKMILGKTLVKECQRLISWYPIRIWVLMAMMTDKMLTRSQV